MLNIDVEYKKGVLFLRLIGKLCEDTKKDLDKVLELVPVVGFKYVMINFEKLYSIDDIGINMIVDSSQKLVHSEGKLLICGYNNLIKLKIENSSILQYALETNNELGAFKLISI